MAKLARRLEGTLLVVEDDAMARETLMEILGKKYPRLRIHLAADAEVGLRLFREVSPDVVLTDLHLPGMSGIEMAEEVRRVAPQVHIVVLTASSDTAKLLDCIRLGISRYVLKPIECAPLFEAIEDCLTRITLERQVEAQHEALRASEAQYRSIFENSTVGLLLTDEEGLILEANPAACSIFVSSGEELRRKRWQELFDLSNLNFETVPGSGCVFHAEVSALRSEGGAVPVEVVTASYLSAEGKDRLSLVVHDLSKRRQAEQAALMARKDWERTFNASSDPIMIIDADHRVRQANLAMAQLAGVALEDAAGEACHLCVHHTDAPIAECPHQALMRDGLPHSAEIYEPRLDKHLLVNVTPLFDLQGGLIGSVHFAKDVTEQKRGEQALAESEERLRLALDSAALGLWDYQVKSGEIICDERCRQMFGIPSGSRVSYEDALQSIHPEDRASVGDAVAAALLSHGEGSPHNRELRVVWPDGSVHWVALYGRVYGGAPDDPEALRFVGVCMDIGARVQAEEDLREREARYRGLFNALQEGCSLLESVLDESPADYRFVEVNPAFERLVGVRRRELIGRSLRDIFSDPNGEFFNCLGRVGLTGVPATMEESPAFGERHLETHVYTPAPGELAVLYSDVSERRKLQEEREKNERLASLGVLAGGIAHDFNNILTAIAGNISLARFKLNDEHEAAARLEESESAVAKAAKLTRQLLTFARGGEPVKKTLATEPLIREVISLSLSGTNCKAELALQEGLWPLHADAGQIHQALNNLLLNAVQAMPRGGVITVSASNETVSCDAGHQVSSGRYLKLVISDQGSGIPPEVLPKIFDPYFTTKPTGSGLGLASVFSIVKRHCGAINASSVLGEGTRFEILLPASEEGWCVDIPAPPRPAAMGVGKAVLVMDDEETIRGVAVRMLSIMGYVPVPCCDGEEAVRLYRERLLRGERFSAVVLDMTVPGGMGGKEAAQRIRDLDPDAVLIISSGYFAEILSDGSNDTVINGMVAKPYNLQQLSEVLFLVLNRDPERS